MSSAVQAADRKGEVLQWSLLFCFSAVQVDIYSFGVLLWELVTATPPIRGRLRPIKVIASSLSVCCDTCDCLYKSVVQTLRIGWPKAAAFESHQQRFLVTH